MLVDSSKQETKPATLEAYFSTFRANAIGNDINISTSVRESVKMLYADWTASGRGYHLIEDRIVSDVLPFIANTHTETNYTGSFITQQYRKARAIIKAHVNAGDDDVLISYGSGMTDVLNKLQRIMGWRIPETFHCNHSLNESQRPVIFITHMEHHSNHTSWLETIGEVVVVPPGSDGLVAVSNFKKEIEKYSDRPKIAAITACSNVTGIETPYHEIAKLMHQYGGLCIVDFACSAPYVSIDMHPDDECYLDAICFSPHKFLGGPGSSGILIFNKRLYKNEVPDVSGGGTVDWTNPWGGRKYVDMIEEREDGGTPAILQTIRAAFAIELKEEMGVENMLSREEELMDILWGGLRAIPKVDILAGNVRNRLGIISFNIDGLHFDRVVQLLNDHFGIQVRGGCSCAGTYGHYLLGIGAEQSKAITDRIDFGDHSVKPGWVRLSIHPIMTNAEASYIVDAIKKVAQMA